MSTGHQLLEASREIKRLNKEISLLKADLEAWKETNKESVKEILKLKGRLEKIGVIR